MPTCRKCGTDFKYRQIIDGSLKILANRKFCLNCSPFGQHNTKQLDDPRRVAGVSKCEICGKPFTLMRGQTTLRFCGRCYCTKRRHDFKAKCVAILGGKCQRCGYSKCIGALEFHHKDPSKKEFTIGNNMNRRWSVVWAELLKCEVVCANCHAEEHWGISSIEERVAYTDKTRERNLHPLPFASKA